jgi:site-specific DNA recombinase
LKRLYRSSEEGIVVLDDILRERTGALKAQREALLQAGDTNTRKTYIRLIIDAVEVDDRVIRILGGKDILQPTANSVIQG